MYKIFLDQQKTFECDIKIEGASLNESQIRLFLESEDFTVSFDGKIDKEGFVKIPIKKLKGVLKENCTGKIFLEVIAEDTVFRPWTSEYETTMSKKVEVNVENHLKESVQEKPKITFNMKEDIWDPTVHINELLNITRRNKISPKKLLDNEKVMDNLINKYCSTNNIYETGDIKILKKAFINKIKQ